MNMRRAKLSPSVTLLGRREKFVLDIGNPIFWSWLCRQLHICQIRCICQVLNCYMPQLAQRSFFKRMNHVPSSFRLLLPLLLLRLPAGLGPLMQRFSVLFSEAHCLIVITYTHTHTHTHTSQTLVVMTPLLESVRLGVTSVYHLPFLSYIMSLALLHWMRCVQFPLSPLLKHTSLPRPQGFKSWGVQKKQKKTASFTLFPPITHNRCQGSSIISSACSCLVHKVH